MNELETTARALVAPGKGILAADESTGSIQKRLEAVGVESTPETRRAYRELLFTTPGMEEFISGVIMFDETLRQATSDGTPFPRVLMDRGIIPGIKVDAGAKPLALAPGETITEGLDGLRERLAAYRGLGARFTKWRAVIKIAEGMPSKYAIWTNAHALARFAALSQEAGLTPIVEPEVLMDGSHTIEQAAQVTSLTLLAVFTELHDQRVRLEGMLLKPNMVVPGSDAPKQASPEEVADATLACFRRTVPAAVPGIVFLSGGQRDEEATANLNAINARQPHPWQVSFSYGRALQTAALRAWAGEPANVADAQRAFYRRAKLNGAARAGRYTLEMESAA
ncbi:MAG TPA: class I fructose-bisphosphate aldolase [Candidatus Dormibacteraeota bacterium]|nr:class I fructose-bisphosphate aldolase [Candidatus Dormibacteraeota bacterium]